MSVSYHALLWIAMTNLTSPTSPSTDRCSVLARELPEALTGTAPVARAWLLVEEPGPWPSRAPGPVSRHVPDADALTALSARFDELPIRLQWIRRPDRRGQTVARRRAFLVHPREITIGAPGWIERLDVGHAGELAELDPDALLAPTAPGIGTRHDGEIIAVCTHAKKDACCATRGRPVAVALAARHPDAVWETTHLGGHRFAATFAVLPEGLVYGHVDVPEALDIVNGHREGRLDVAHLRGRAALDGWRQAAECFLREHLGLCGLADVTIGEADPHPDGTRTVAGRTPQGSFAVRLERRPLGQPRLLGCAKDVPEDPGGFFRVDVTAIGS
jgi:hypothetical protein